MYPLLFVSLNSLVFNPSTRQLFYNHMTRYWILVASNFGPYHMHIVEYHIGCWEVNLSPYIILRQLWSWVRPNIIWESDPHLHLILYTLQIFDSDCVRVLSPTPRRVRSKFVLGNVLRKLTSRVESDLQNTTLGTYF